MQQPGVDYSRKWYVMAAVGMSILLATIDGSIINVALPTLVWELNTDFATVEWVVLAYLLALVTVLSGESRTLQKVVEQRLTLLLDKKKLTNRCC